MTWEIVLPNALILHISELKSGESEELHGDSIIRQFPELLLSFLVTVRKT